MNAIRIPRASEDVPDPVDLRAHDPARGLTSDPAAADALLSSIVATPVDMSDDESAPAESPAPTPTGRHPRRRRVWLAAAAAVAVLAGGAITQSATPAYAGWTATPTAVAKPDVPSQVIETCRRIFTPPGAPVDPDYTPADAAQMQPVLAERRGPYMLVVLHSDSHVMDCTVQYRAMWQWSFPFYAAAGSASFGTLSPTRVVARNLGPRDLSTLNVGGGELREGDEMAQATGVVGAEVARLDIVTDTRRIQASVNDGFFAAWWPGKPADDQTEFHLTYRDGSSRVVTAGDTYIRDIDG